MTLYHDTEPNLRALSLGAGVQSTTLALMAAVGEIAPAPEVAIFADTQWEPSAVYRHLAWLETALPFPIVRATAGSVRAAVVGKVTTNHRRFAAVPFFTGSGGMGQRQCTREFKLAPITRALRERLGYGKGERIPRSVRVEVWVGITTDEASRMKPSRHKWQINRWPLIELGMTRTDCLRWMERHGYPRPPRSACIGCPYRSNAEWRLLRDEAPDDWADAVEVDRLLRENHAGRDRTKLDYMHRSLRPLDEVDLSTAEERGQLDLFLHECEGLCGV